MYMSQSSSPSAWQSGSLQLTGGGLCSQTLLALQSPMEGRRSVADFQNGLQRSSHWMLNAYSQAAGKKAGLKEETEMSLCTPNLRQKSSKSAKTTSYEGESGHPG